MVHAADEPPFFSFFFFFRRARLRPRLKILPFRDLPRVRTMNRERGQAAPV